MKILFASSEVFPYAKSGGLGDVASALPKELNKTQGIKTVTILPLYQTIDREKYQIFKTDLVLEKTLNKVRHQFDFYKTKLDENILFVYNPILCDRMGFYYDSFGAYGDNHLRFALFSYAIAQYLMEENFDVLHLNDWQSALAANIVKSIYKINIKVIFTIHNLAYQGIFDKKTIEELGLDWRDFNYLGFEFYDAINFMKAGIAFSDAITTVSPTYSQEICTKEHGCELDRFLGNMSYKLYGILNGIDLEQFSPKNDPFIAHKFDLLSIEKKHKNKQILLEQTGLKGENKPIFAFIGRFAEQKGVEMLSRALVHMKDFHANFVILGSGEKYLEETMKHLQKENVFVKIGYDEAFSRQIYAGSDFLMMPSVYEPCGLNQMIALAYGTLPVVRETGGLKDSVEDFHIYNENSSKGPGVTYHDHNVFAFLIAISKSLSIYADKEFFTSLQKEAMKKDFSQKHSAAQYLKLYRSI